MIALIDSDILCHSIGFSTEGKEEQIARDYTDLFIQSILNETNATEYECWLSDSRENNFRHKLSKTYKANRTADKPTHYEVVKEHLVTHHKARIAFGMEADDMLAIRYNELNGNLPPWEEVKAIICTLDKDLDQIEGHHYRWAMWRNGEVWKPSRIYTVQYEEALVFFWKQMLMGDTADNIKGIPKIGPKTADKLLSKWTEVSDFERVVKEQYEKQFGGLEQYEINYKLLYILRTRDEAENLSESTGVD